MSFTLFPSLLVARYFSLCQLWHFIRHFVELIPLFKLEGSPFAQSYLATHPLRKKKKKRFLLDYFNGHTRLRARLPNWKQGREEKSAKKQGQGYLFSRLSCFKLYSRRATAFAGFGNLPSQQCHQRKYPVACPFESFQPYGLLLMIFQSCFFWVMTQVGS